MKEELFLKDVKVTLKDGKIFTGQFYEIFEEEKTILINNTIINIKDIEKMEEIKSNFISSLNKKQLEFLNKNIINFDKIETDEIVEILTKYLQTNCIINDEVNEEGVLIESILDILGEM